MAKNQSPYYNDNDIGTKIVPTVIETIASMLGLKTLDIQQFYDDSKSFRDYINSVAQDMKGEIDNKLLQVTPSTTPRFDVPWMTEQLKKRQDTLFNIKKQITDLETKAYEASQENYYGSEEHGKAVQDSVKHGLGAIFTQPGAKRRKEFKDRKTKEINNFNKQSAQLAEKANQIAKAPLVNTNPTYQTIQERRKNAQIQKTAVKRQK